ncbi:MAG: polyphosphate kinase 2 family protein [Blastocatellia bacterium]|nr:polyphosphate kinase 2 family protein [Blastocatellia bacterium]
MNTDKYKIDEDSKIDLAKHSTEGVGDPADKKNGVAVMRKNIERMAELQSMLYAQDVHSLLIVFQAMDAAGKDGAIKAVMSGLNPQGCNVTSFKQPSAEERDHDYLWRHQRALPERGRIGIFNRSHYEEVLVVRVHPSILQAQALPAEIKEDPKVWDKRLRQIRNWESHLVENGTHIMKFFLNISRDEQRRRFLSRIQEPEKNWKFSAGDLKERAFWDEYMKSYEAAISATSTADAPWYVIPADRKWFARLAISEIIVKKLESMDLHYPTVSDEDLAALIQAGKLLEAEK